MNEERAHRVVLNGRKIMLCDIRYFARVCEMIPAFLLSTPFVFPPRNLLARAFFSLLDLAYRRDSPLYVIDPALLQAECLAELDHAMYQLHVAASKGSRAGKCVILLADEHSTCN